MKKQGLFTICTIHNSPRFEGDLHCLWNENGNSPAPCIFPYTRNEIYNEKLKETPKA